MGLIPRPFHYHVLDDPAFGALAPLASATLTVPRFGGGGTEARTMYSLKRDLDELRRRGVAKGIADAGVVSVGNSAGGRPLQALKIGNGAAHKVLFTGAHHAREWISVEIPYLVAEYLIETYTDSPGTPKEKRIKHLLMNRQIWFVPISNPDGHAYTTSVNRNWRPNRNTHAMPGRTIARAAANGGNVTYPAGTYRGVDINRNYNGPGFGTETFHHGFVKTSLDPRDGGEDSIWCGIAGSGEAESAAIDALIRANAFRSSITYHSFSQDLLFPDLSVGDVFVQWVGNGMTTLINGSGGVPYTYESGSALYPTTGDLMEFTWSVVPGRPTFLPELRPKDTDSPSWFFSGLPENQIEPCFNENLAAALALINCAGHNAVAALTTTTVPSAMPAAKCQFVRHCWQVFQGWTP